MRYQCAVPHGRREGVFLGVFATVNTMAKRGELSPQQEAFRRANNDWFDANMTLPTEVVPELYSEAHPQGVAWFKASAKEHLARVPGYLAILDAHGVPWHELRCVSPGTILYEDALQVIATPCPGLPPASEP